MSMPSAEACWQAVRERNSNYDGQFVVAVKTTRIYCRPSCSSRTPKQENVNFYEDPKDAEANGFRACKRCHPKDSFALDEQAERVQMLCDYIQANLMSENVRLEELSRIAHWSPFHLQRTFKEVVGITPRQYVESRRIKCFKEQLKAGYSVTAAAMDAGYSSSSRVYDHAYSRLGMTPSDYQQGGDDITIAYHIADSPLGRLLIAMTQCGICAIEMGSNDEDLVKKLHKEFPAAYIYQDEEYLHLAMESVLDYLQGWQPHLNLPLDIRVTAFQQRVLDALQKIPYGETRSYGEIAKMIGQPKAARAVGNACNKNPVPLVIPCHRVVGSDGDLVGYAFGLERKEKLLQLEKAETQETA